MKNKRCVVIAGVALACVMLIGGVLAVSHDSSIFSNIFGISSYKTVATEVFSSPSNWQTCESVPKTITVKNESSGPIVARIRYTEEWVASDRTTQLDLVDSATNLRMAIVDRDNMDKWLLNDDGYYYYYKTVAPGETTASFMKSVTLNCDANLAGSLGNTCTQVNGRTVCTTDASAYSDATYTLRATTSTIQADAAKTEWGYESDYVEATLLSGSQICSKISDKTKIERVNTLPPDFPAAGDSRLAWVRMSTEMSEAPVYMWSAADYVGWGGDAEAEGYAQDTIYWYTKATKIFYNPDMHKFLNSGSGGTSLGSAYTSFYSQFDSSRIMNLESSFSGLSNFDLSWLMNWDVSNVTDMSWSFRGNDYTDLSFIGGWNVSNVQDFSGAFGGNTSLTDVSAIKNWDVSSTANLTSMFSGSNNITNLGELSWFH